MSLSDEPDDQVVDPIRRFVVRLPGTLWATNLSRLPPYERAFHFNRMLIHALSTVQRTGVRVRYQPNELIVPVSLQMSLVDYIEFERVRAYFNCSASALVIEMYEQTDNMARAHLELEYKRRGLPGDPSTLSDKVLHTWLNEEVPSSLRDAFADLTAQTSHLQKRVNTIFWKESLIIASLIYAADEESLTRFAGVLGIPAAIDRDMIFERIAKYLS